MEKIPPESTMFTGKKPKEVYREDFPPNDIPTTLNITVPMHKSYTVIVLENE